MLYVIETKTTLRLFVDAGEDPIEKVLTGVEAQLAEMYGDENVEIVEVREPTEEEREFFNTNVMNDIEPEEVDVVIEDTPTQLH